MVTDTGKNHKFYSRGNGINLIFKGFTSEDDVSDDKRILLGNYRYDNANSKKTLQYFDVQVRSLSIFSLQVKRTNKHFLKSDYRKN